MESSFFHYTTTKPYHFQTESSNLESEETFKTGCNRNNFLHLEKIETTHKMNYRQSGLLLYKK